MTTGIVALVGGDEFKPGNEEQDRLLVQHRGPGAAYVIATAAARQRPDLAVATAQCWFKSLGLDVVELPVLKRSHANSPRNVELAEQGGLFYLTGGDPGLVVDVLHDTAVWNAIVERWKGGAALAGSSAGAMALGQWSLIRGRHPGDAIRRAKPALALIPKIAVAPHFERYGRRWVASVLDNPPAPDVVILGIDERSAALWDGHTWTAHGPGEITLITADSRGTHHSGASLPLPSPHASDRIA